MPLGWVARETMPPIRSLPVSFGLERVGHVVLVEVAGAPARHVEGLVVDREIDVGDQRRHALKPLSIGGSWSGSAGSAGMSITFLTAHRSPSRYQVQIDDERSSSDSTQLTKP